MGRCLFFRGQDIPPVNTGLAIDGSAITVVKAQKGLVVDQDALRGQLQTLLLAFQTAELPVPMAVTKDGSTTTTVRPASPSTETGPPAS